jgi:hypothetical protein
MILKLIKQDGLNAPGVSYITFKELHAGELFETGNHASDFVRKEKQSNGVDNDYDEDDENGDFDDGEEVEMHAEVEVIV